MIRLLLLLVFSLSLPTFASEPARPNIIYILADDLGCGDVQAYNPDGKIPTPHLNRLAEEGVRFTDAHAGSSVCTPTRYGVLTGRYAWRTHLASGVLRGYDRPLIPENHRTVASMLQQQGYHTACIGKWHLGLTWGLQDGAEPSNQPKFIRANIDFSKPITSGPNQLGFDHFYGISASLDMDPYVYIENDQVTSLPTQEIERNHGKKIWLAGPIADNFQHIAVLDHLTEKAVAHIRQQRADTPFFLYMPLTSPHPPIIPTQAWQGKSGLNEWGDFVMQTDAVIGQVMRALDEQGLAENTLFIVTSDNGATPKADFGFLQSKGHDPSGPWRGYKTDIFEGGHRVPFIARWPGVTPPGSTCHATICLTDLMATAKEITGTTDPGGEDSHSILPLLQGREDNARPAVVHHSANGSFAIRSGPWKLIFTHGSGGWGLPQDNEANKQGLPPIQLYHLVDDPAETTNLHEQHPEIVEQLTALLQSFVDNGRSVPGQPATNDRNVRFQKTD